MKPDQFHGFHHLLFEVTAKLDFTFDVNHKVWNLDDVNCNFMECIADEIYMEPDDVHAPFGQYRQEGYTSFQILHPTKIGFLPRTAMPSLGSAFQSDLVLLLLAMTAFRSFAETFHAKKSGKQCTTAVRLIIVGPPLLQAPTASSTPGSSSKWC